MELMKQISQWYDAREHQKIVDAILNLPEVKRTDDLLGQLAVAYNNLENYEQAISVLEQMQTRQEETCQWQYRMGYARYYGAQLQAKDQTEQTTIMMWLKQAKQAFTRCLFLNPHEEIVQDCRIFLEKIEEKLSRSEKNSQSLELCNQTGVEAYEEAEMEAVENHIIQYFGVFSNVFHEIISPDIHVDICIIPPTERRNYYTLVTMGMGAHAMHVPEEMSQYKLERAELLICLPAAWKMGNKEEIWYWPLRLLKRLARLPIHSDTWLGWGHTVDNQEPYAENTELCGALIIAAQNVSEHASVCVLPNGSEVHFYQVLPLYQEEMAFKRANDAETLLDYMADISFVADPKRPNIGLALEADYALDWADMHIETIQEKHLPVDAIAAYNHLAIYLRWCIEADLMSEHFMEQYPKQMQDVKQGENCLDLRLFLRDELDGWLIYPNFNESGVAFAQYYYNGDDEDAPYYPADVDDYALHYFGAKRYHSAAFQEEAYLFMPFDERYYQGMKKYLDYHYTQWCLRQTMH